MTLRLLFPKNLQECLRRSYIHDSCCTQLDDYFRDGFLGYLKEVTVVAQYQEQLLKWSDGIMEAHNEVIARWDEFQEILHLHPQGTVVGTFLIPCVV